MLDPSPSRLIFTYGSLKENGSANHLLQQQGATFVGRALIDGKTFSLHLNKKEGFPVLRREPASSQQSIMGDVYRVPESALGWLDEFEGINPDLESPGSPPNVTTYRRTAVTEHVRWVGDLPPVTDQGIEVYLMDQGHPEDLEEIVGDTEHPGSLYTSYVEDNSLEAKASRRKTLESCGHINYSEEP